MIYLLAGHSNKDPGASGARGHVEFTMTKPFIKYEETPIKESTLTKDLRNLVLAKINQPKFALRLPSVTIDDDNDSLKTVLKKIKSTEDDIICDLHFNSGTRTSTGVAVIHPEVPSDKEKQLAKALADKLAAIMGINNRGTMKPSETPRKKLGVMNPKGTNVLIEVCFISNPADVAAYDLHRDEVAEAIADILTLAHIPPGASIGAAAGATVGGGGGAVGGAVGGATKGSGGSSW